ncbi:hypothetical protein BT96DRAFT_1012137 [Gymnopus androsaceus JB14]|uniref:Uncharacterized protein n=1 Tax=Gymnopus androsaceus JB14 TaxID=1447944 RepID=A0A6A4IP47_9AGAR|nr:hypothetical protein BT96DRAFT_1012137 [Gymnopus androsaceus JB14]
MSATAARVHLLTQFAASLQQRSPDDDYSYNPSRSEGSQKILNHLSILLGPSSTVTVSVGPLLLGHSINSVIFRSFPDASATGSQVTFSNMQLTVPPSYAEAALPVKEVSNAPGTTSKAGPSVHKATRNSEKDKRPMSSRTHKFGQLDKEEDIEAVVSPENICARMRQSPAEWYHLYVSETIRVLRFYSASYHGGDKNLSHLYEYFVGHCHHMIDSRIQKVLDVYFPTDDAGNLLMWELEGLLEPAEVRIAAKSPPSQFLRAVKVPCTTTHDGFLTFIFNSSSAPKWIDAIYNVLVFIRSSLKRLKDQTTNDLEFRQGLENTSKAIVALHGFLNHLIPKQLWVSASLNNRLQDLRVKHWNLNVDDSLPSESQNTMWEECSIFFCAINAICAWTIASRALVKHKLFSQKNIVFSVQILDVPDVALPAVELDSVLKQWGLAGKDVSEYVQQQLKLASDAGRSHCEAGLLAALQAAIAELVESLKQETYVIGVAKKCCPTCRHLAKVIKDVHGLQLDLPGSHTQYHPWRPPASSGKLPKAQASPSVSGHSQGCPGIWPIPRQY